MEMLKLKNGSEEPKPTVVTTMLSLKTQMEKGLPGMLLIYDLHQICLGKIERVSKDNLQKLCNLSLIQTDGKPHDSIRNIVLSAIEDKGLSMSVGSPVA